MTERDANARARGHDEYKTWLNAVGRCFSPFCQLKEPLSFGQWESRTVEGLYQGLKLVGIEELSCIHRTIGFRIYSPGPPSLVYVPDIMAVRGELGGNLLFQLLKSGHKYNSKRNRYFGRLDEKRRNWSWSETWLHPTLLVPVCREQFVRDVFVPAFSALLSQYEAEVSQLRAFWKNGQHGITDEMHIAHGHLKYVEQIVNRSPL